MKLMVDINELIKTSEELTELINTQEQLYDNLKETVTVKTLQWRGTDYEAFKKRWEELMEDNSNFLKQQKMLQSYNDYLIRCKKEYSILQDKARIRARNLPK